MLDLLLFIDFVVDKEGDSNGDAVVTIKGALQDAQDAKRQVLETASSQRSYDNRGSNRSDGNRGSNQYDSNRGSYGNRDRDYNSRDNTRHQFNSSSNSRTDNAYSNGTQSVPQQSADTSEPMEDEPMIDWQAAARESVCICTLSTALHQNNNKTQPFCFPFHLLFLPLWCL